MKSPIKALVLLAGAIFSLSLNAQTAMLTASGVTGAADSTCPAGIGASRCSGGWFAIDGSSEAVVRVWEDTGTATVYLDQAFTPGVSAPNYWTPKSWTDPAATEVAVSFASGRVGWVRIRVTAVGGGGVVKATIRTVAPGGGF
jgi:hypothetical protein